MKKLFSLIVMALMTMGAFAETWTVVGTAANLNGKSWDPAATVNDMTLGEDGLYTLKVVDATLAANDSYEYKVAANHSWALNYGANGLQNGANIPLSVEEDGLYDIVYTFNPDTHIISAETTKKEGEVVIPEATWTVVGNSAALFGVEWTPAAEANDMVKGEDGIFTKAYTDVVLAAGTIEYKVAKNHSWDVSYGLNGVPSNDANKQLAIAEDGKYDVVFTFNPEDTKSLTATATKKEEVVIEHTYTVAGPYDEDGLLIFGAAWDPTFTANDMEKQADGTYKKVYATADIDPDYELEAGDIEFKVVKDHDWNVASYPAGDNYKLNIPSAGKYVITITFNPQTEEVNAVAEKEVVKHTYEATFVNDGEWEDVFAYVWAGNENPLGAWPGTKLEKNGEQKTVGEKAYDIYAVKFEGAEDLAYSIIFNNGANDQTNDLQFNDGKEYNFLPTPEPEPVYTVVGMATDEFMLFGETAWDMNNTDNDMVKQEDGSYLWTANSWDIDEDAILPGQLKIEYKIVKNHETWMQEGTENLSVVVPEDGHYTLTIIYKPETNEATATLTKRVVKHTYEATFVNDGEWEEVYAYVWTGNGENKELGDWPGTKLEKNGEQKTVGEKVYDIYAVKFEGAEDLAYSIIFNNGANDQTNDLQFNDGKEYNFLPTPEPEPVYTVVGMATDEFMLFGETAWDMNNTDNDMVKQEDGSYLWTANSWDIDEDAILPGQLKIEYKIVKNHETWMQEGTENLSVVVPEDGHYTLTIIYKPETNEATATLTKRVEAHTFAATFVNGGEWEDVYAYVWNGNELKLGAWPGTKLEKTDATKAVGEKTYDIYAVTFDGDATEAYSIIFNNGKEGDELVQTDDLKFEDGTEYSFGLPEKIEPATVEIRGSFNNWMESDASKMVKVADAYIYTLDVDLTNDANDQEFKFVVDGNWMGFNAEGLALEAEEGLVEKQTAEGAEDNFILHADKYQKFTFKALWTESDDVLAGWKLAVVGTEERAVTEDVYNVVGDPDMLIFGEDGWWEKSSDNPMVKQDDGTYVWSRSTWDIDEDFEFAAGDVLEFKVVKNHSYNAGSWPAENYKLTIGEAGHYTITVCFDPAKEKVTATATKRASETQTFAAQFVNGKEWEKVYAYVWSGNGEEEKLGAWPGTQLSDIADMYHTAGNTQLASYKVSFEGASDKIYNIIFNNGANDQTKDLQFNDGKIYAEGLVVNIIDWDGKGAAINMPELEWIEDTSIDIYDTTHPVKVFGLTELKADDNGNVQLPQMTKFETGYTVDNGNGEVEADAWDVAFIPGAYYAYDKAITGKVKFVVPDNVAPVNAHNVKIAVQGGSGDGMICYPRKFEVGKMYTVSLPFNASTEAGKFYELTALEGDKVTFAEVTALEPNMPYVFVAASEYPFESVSDYGFVGVRPAEVEVNGAVMKNVTKTTEVENVYGIKDGEFVKVNTGTCNPYRAYLETTGAAASKLAIDLGTTGVAAIKALVGEGADVYDLQGRRVQTAQKGIYIVNGKTVVVK
ncbi:MAG: starch-binding protein [Prevotella sp.]|nr:starch-binding protein [Prevotella sp.]